MTVSRLVSGVLFYTPPTFGPIPLFSGNGISTLPSKSTSWPLPLRSKLLGMTPRNHLDMFSARPSLPLPASLASIPTTGPTTLPSHQRPSGPTSLPSFLLPPDSPHPTNSRPSIRTLPSFLLVPATCTSCLLLWHTTVFTCLLSVMWSVPRTFLPITYFVASTYIYWWRPFFPPFWIPPTFALRFF